MRPGLLARFNGLTEPYRLSVGESLLILKPAQLYTVQPGDSVYSISQTFSLGRNELYRLNPGLSAQERLYPGQVLVTKLEDTPNYEAQLMGYAYPWVSERVLRGILPYAQALGAVYLRLYGNGRAGPPGRRADARAGKGLRRDDAAAPFHAHRAGQLLCQRARRGAGERNGAARL